VALSACSSPAADGEGEVSAVEDLMREHGALRRVLVIYREAAAMLRSNGAAPDLAALSDATALFQTFGEAYHERELEEAHIFPTVRRAGGTAADLVGVLLTQHERGRGMTTLIRSRCTGVLSSAGDRAGLADVLDAFARMYEAHAAFEDTVVFQAWKAAMSDTQRREAAEQFEAIERAQFKGDGFEKAVGQVAAIEARLGFGDLARYTPPPITGAGPAGQSAAQR
jgi:hemerythrin-like domain-containing protein